MESSEFPGRQTAPFLEESDKILDIGKPALFGDDRDAQVRGQKHLFGAFQLQIAHVTVGRETKFSDKFFVTCGDYCTIELYL